MKVKSKSEIVRECILSDPNQTLDQIREKTKVGQHTIVYERYRLIDEGHILAPKSIRRYNTASRNLNRLFDVCHMFETFGEYANEVLENMPIECAVVLLNPGKEQEENMKDGFLESLRSIQKICKKIENKYRNKI